MAVNVRMSLRLVRQEVFQESRLIPYWIIYIIGPKIKPREFLVPSFLFGMIGDSNLRSFRNYEKSQKSR